MFPKFAGKYLCQRLYFNTVAGCLGCKKQTRWHKSFTMNLVKYLRTPFLQNISEDCFWLYAAILLKWGIANSVWKTSDEYSLSRKANLRSTVQLCHFFLGSINFQCMISLVYIVYCQKQSPD